MSDQLIEVDVEDVLDWAYCPVRVWWRTSGMVPDSISSTHGKVTGEMLVKRTITRSLTLYYNELRSGVENVSFVEVVATVWKKALLKKWGLRKLADPLLEYSTRRQTILDLFSEKGHIRQSDGSVYERPMWTRAWLDHAVNSGLLDLRKAIDSHQEKAGLTSVSVGEADIYRGPIGLADAFASSMLIAANLEENLPDVSEVIGIDLPVYVDLLSVRLVARADLVVELGAAPRQRGRPRIGGEGVARPYIGYELFLYDEEIPPVYNLSRDLRIFALGQSLPNGYKEKDAVVDGVEIRHLFSGQKQKFNPQPGEQFETLESVSRAFVKGRRAGIYIPRMLRGWEACGPCHFRPLCYSDSGVMDAFNPPLASQIMASQEMVGEMRHLINSNGKNFSKGTFDVLRNFLRWMEQTPGLTPEGALFMLDAIQSDLES